MGRPHGAPRAQKAGGDRAAAAHAVGCPAEEERCAAQIDATAVSQLLLLVRMHVW